MNKHLYEKCMLALLLFNISIMPLQAMGAPRENKVSLVMENATLIEVLREVEEPNTTHFLLQYRPDQY
ncbi:MAG: hypothetical protein WD824_20535 [Cyclobacteriaceae bacterium]